MSKKKGKEIRVNILEMLKEELEDTVAYQKLQAAIIERRLESCKKKRRQSSDQ